MVDQDAERRAAVNTKRTKGSKTTKSGITASSCPSISSCLRALKVVTDPERELRLPERAAAAERRKPQVFPVLVQQRLPGPVEVHREPERECLEADAVGRSRVHEPQSTDHGRFTEDRCLLKRVERRIADDRRVGFRRP